MRETNFVLFVNMSKVFIGRLSFFVGHVIPLRDNI